MPSYLSCRKQTTLSQKLDHVDLSTPVLNRIGSINICLLFLKVLFENAGKYFFFLYLLSFLVYSKTVQTIDELEDDMFSEDKHLLCTLTIMCEPYAIISFW